MIHKRAMARALGLKSDGGNAFMKTLNGKTLGSKIPLELRKKIENHLVFKPLSGDPAHGYEASVLIDLCGALIDAEPDLLPNQKFLARQAESSFALPRRWVSSLSSMKRQGSLKTSGARNTARSGNSSFAKRQKSGRNQSFLMRSSRYFTRHTA